MDRVTAFVVSAGKNPNLPDCLAALDQQTIPHRRDIIRDFAPMSAAFQEMINRCHTPYYVQVDEDMILESHALWRMLQAMDMAPENVSQIAFRLQDVHLEIPIYGVKVYRHAAMARFPYRLDCLSCEMEQVRRMEGEGWVQSLDEEILGRHSPKWTEELIFERYRDLGEKDKRYRYHWLRYLPQVLAEKYAREGGDLNFYAIMGYMASRLSPGMRDEEKNVSKKSAEWITIRSARAYPHSATLFITARCNFRCPFCLRQGSGVEEFDEWRARTALGDLFFRFGDRLKGLCICGFGEPLLVQALPDLIRYIREKAPGITLSIITNGSLLEERLEGLMAAPPNFVSVSLNAGSAIQHERQTGIPGQWDRILRGIRKAQDAGIPVHVSYIADRGNLEQVPEFLRIAGGLPAHTVYINNILPHNATDAAGRADFLAQVLTRADEATIEGWKGLPGAQRVKKWPTLIDPAHPRRDCHFPWTSIAVDGNGSYSICNSIFPPCRSNGNLRDLHVWRSDYAENFRRTFAQPEIDWRCQHCFRQWE